MKKLILSTLLLAASSVSFAEWREYKGYRVLKWAYLPNLYSED